MTNAISLSLKSVEIRLQLLWPIQIRDYQCSDLMNILAVNIRASDILQKAFIVGTDYAALFLVVERLHGSCIECQAGVSTSLTNCCYK